MIELSIRSCKSGGIDTKIHGVSVIGRVDMNEEEAAANFSFLSVEEVEGKDVGLIRKQRRMAEGLMDSVSCKVFAWGLNDRQQLGSSQTENKVGGCEEGWVEGQSRLGVLSENKT
jgi:E3 ubiquitin-protein ligase HERC2